MKIENLTNDNTVAISTRKEQIDSLQIKYNEMLNMMNQDDNKNEELIESFNLDFNQIKKEMEYLHLEIEFLENQLQDETLLMNKEIESFKNQIIPENTMLDYDYVDNKNLFLEDSNKYLNEYKFIKLDDIINVLTKYNFNIE